MTLQLAGKETKVLISLVFMKYMSETVGVKGMNRLVGRTGCENDPKLLFL